MRHVTTFICAFLFVGVVIAPIALGGSGKVSGKARIAAPGDLPNEPLVGVRSAGRALSKPDHAVAGFSRDFVQARRAGSQQAPAAGPVKLSGGGPVGLIGTSNDGTLALWTEDVGGGIFELFQRPIDGSGPAINLSPGTAIPPGVVEAQIAPDDSAIVFTLDAGVGSVDVFSIAVGGGGGAVPLSGFAGPPASAGSIGIAPDSSTAFWFDTDLTFATGTTELWRGTIGISGSGVQLTGMGGLYGAATGVVFVEPTPDSLIFIIVSDTAGQAWFDSFIVPAGAAGPGSEVQETFTLGSGVTTIRTASDSSTYYAIGDQGVAGRLDVYEQTIGLGTTATVNSPMAGGGAGWLALANDDSLLGYSADRDAAGVREAYAVPTAGPLPDPGVTLSTPGFSLPNSFLNFNADATHAVWASGELPPGEIELFGRPTDGSGPQVLLHDIADGSGDGLGFFTNVGMPAANQRAYYPRFVGGVPPIPLHSVRADGTEPFKTVNAPYLAGDSAWSAFLPQEGQRLTAYITGPIASGGATLDRVFVGPLRADLPVEQASPTADLVGGEVGIFDFFFAPSENHVLYTHDADVNGLPELYSYTMDSDADAVDNPADNCKFVSNPGQGLVPLPALAPGVVALDHETFTWGLLNYQEVAWARGPLPVSGAYATNGAGSMFDGDRYVDAVDPGPGLGNWYLFKVDCPGGDWGNAGRNASLP